MAVFSIAKVREASGESSTSVRIAASAWLFQSSSRSARLCPATQSIPKPKNRPRR